MTNHVTWTTRERTCRHCDGYGCQQCARYPLGAAAHIAAAVAGILLFILY